MLITPDRQAATYSPALWPIMAAGSMPHDASSFAIAYSVANNDGRAMDGRSRSTSAAPAAGNSAARRSRPFGPSTTAAHASIDSR